MPEYVKREKRLHLKSEEQVSLMIKALEDAYNKAEPKEKRIYSRLLKKFEK